MSVVPFVTIPAVGTPDAVRAPVQHVDDRRLVAVAVDVAELVRPGSDLARMLATVPRADLLLASEVPRLRSVRVVAPPPVHVDDLPPVELDEHALAEWEPEPAPVPLAGLNLPGLQVHRLDLRAPLATQDEDDLVAALSELVGFDPEPGVSCLAPVPVDADSAVASRAAQRIAQVYGLPLLRFRCRGRSAAAVGGAR
jgi:hypothetical protein